MTRHMPVGIRSDMGGSESEPLPSASSDDGPAGASPLAGAVLGFVGLVILLFGLPLAVALPAGLIWGKKTDAPTVLVLVGVSLIGSIFVYAATLLIGAAWRAATGGGAGKL